MIRILIALLSLVVAVPAFADSVVVTAAHMVDAENGRLLDSPVVVITDGRIVSVVTGANARPIIPEDARRVDLGDMTILPGLIDMHVHLTSLAEIGGYRPLEYTDSFFTVVGVANARRTLDAGFTTVRNVGSDGFADVGLRQAIDEGYILGPRIMAAGYLIGATGGHCDRTGLPPSLDTPYPGATDGADAFRAKIRWLHKYGARVIKICATGGVFSIGDSVGGQQLSAAELRAISDEAHMLHMRVAAHAHGDEGIRAAIENGIDTIEHASLASDATIRLAAQRHTWFSMDIYNDDYIQATGTSNGTLPDQLAKARQVGTAQRETFRRAVRAGVPMIFGTDAGVYPHGQNARQFAKMVEWGMTPAQAIRSATVNAAEALDWVADVGLIAPGRYGDIIAVAGNPLENVRLLEDVRFVMKGGVVVKGSATRE